MKLLNSKFICPVCFGNGYRRITKDASQPNIKVVIACKACDNQGEIENDTKNVHALRYLANL